MARRDDILSRIAAERARQFDLPGIEFDTQNGPTDWTTIVAHYLFEEIRRGPDLPSRLAFEDGLVKAGAVILAALEHCDLMEKDGRFA